MTISLEADASALAPKALQWVPYIRYPVRFQEDQPMRVLIDSGSEVNTITPAYAVELGLITRKTSVKAQKIDGLPLETHDMASARSSLQDSLERVRFFEETFLLADTSIEVVLGMPFLSFSNVDVEFEELGKLIWRSYTTAKALLTISQVKLINKREFAKAALDRRSEIFLVYVTILELPIAMPIHLSRALQVVDDSTMTALQWNKALTEMPIKYSDYADVFSSDQAMELPENIEINEHTIELIEGK